MEIPLFILIPLGILLVLAVGAAIMFGLVLNSIAEGMESLFRR
jgi:hypothetical protein